jgi:malate dehydrogenase (quinone)
MERSTIPPRFSERPDARPALADPIRFPRVAAFLADLPDGLASYPECQQKGSVLWALLDGKAIDPPANLLPAPVFEQLRSPPPPNVWLPTVVGRAAWLAVLDLRCPHDDAAALDEADRAYEGMARSSMYAGLLRHVSPELLIRGASYRWKALYRGIELAIDEVSPGAAVAMLRYPDHLTPRFNARSAARGLSISLRIAADQPVRIELSEWTPTRSTFKVRWGPRSEPTVPPPALARAARAPWCAGQPRQRSRYHPAMVVDVVLIGAGIMSATLGALLRKLEPGLRLHIYERLDSAAAESSDAWNNAGTGHSGFCELNYTPAAADGSVDVSKARAIAEQFALSLQFWAALIDSGELGDPGTFLRTVPHLSFVRGEADARFLEERHRQLVRSPLFEGMELTRDPGEIAAWAPLVMDGAPRSEPLAATRVAGGTDVNFGALARALVASLSEREGVSVHLGHEVSGIRREEDLWSIDVRDLKTDRTREVKAKFVFIGAGGYSLKLLEQSGIPESAGYGAFPVSGQWLRCTNRSVIERHHAKVYGKAEVGAPPMSVPHLDSRWIDGKKELLFGPYAGFTTRFLKKGSWLDLLGSIGMANALPVMSAGVENFELTQYLIGQAMLTEKQRLALLHRYCPMVSNND